MEVSSLHYYSSSFIHGFVELVVLYIVLYVTLVQHKVLFNFFSINIKNEMKVFYLNFLLKKGPFLVVILIVGALVEVYISNRLFLL